MRIIDKIHMTGDGVDNRKKSAQSIQKDPIPKYRNGICLSPSLKKRVSPAQSERLSWRESVIT